MNSAAMFIRNLFKFLGSVLLLSFYRPLHFPTLAIAVMNILVGLFDIGHRKRLRVPNQVSSPGNRTAIVPRRIVSVSGPE